MCVMWHINILLIVVGSVKYDTPFSFKTFIYLGLHSFLNKNNNDPLFSSIIGVTTQPNIPKRTVIVMNSIILHLLTIIQYQYRQICWLILFISKYIPLKQWAFDDSHSPKYQKFKTDILPNVIYFEKVEYQRLLEYYKLRYGKVFKPVNTLLFTNV